MTTLRLAFLCTASLALVCCASANEQRMAAQLDSLRISTRVVDDLVARCSPKGIQEVLSAADGGLSPAEATTRAQASCDMARADLAQMTSDLDETKRALGIDGGK